MKKRISRLSPARMLKILFYRILGAIWFIPFGFYRRPLKVSNITPHPLVPRNLRDLTLHKMMFQDNYVRAVVADKVAVRGWVAEKVDAKYLIPLYDVCEKPTDLRLTEYPMPYVIKSNHASGHVHFVKTPEDFDGVMAKTTKWLSEPYRLKWEWAYRDIKRQLIVEKMLTDENGNPPADIKVHCIFGEPVMLLYIPVNDDSLLMHYLDKNWEEMPTDSTLKSNDPLPPKPAELDQILYLVKQLTSEFDFIRLDVYIYEGQVYFGELTSFNLAGNRHPHKLDYDLMPVYKQLWNKKIAEERARYSAMVGKD